MAATSSTAAPTSTSASCEARWGSVCATGRPWDRSESTSGSKWTVEKSAASSSRVSSGTSVLARRSDNAGRLYVLHSVTRALTVLALGAAVSLMPTTARGEVIDRILAVVNRELITLSDVAAAIRLGLVSVPQDASDPTRAVLDTLIDRQLELGETNRYQPPE